MPRTIDPSSGPELSGRSELIVSGYTEEGYGAGAGAARFELLPDGTIGECLVEGAAVKNASFLADGSGLLLAVEELPSGSVIALDPQTLDVIGRAPSGGSDTCHVALVGGTVWAANYSSGTAVVVPLASLLEGAAQQSPELLSHPGSGPVADRQGESHAHQVTATRWGTVLVADLGADRVDEYSASSRVRLGSAELPPGTGPRHVTIKGDFLLVAGELDGHLHVLRRTPLDESVDAPTAGGAGEPAVVEAGGYFWHWLFKVPLAETADEVTSVPEFFPSHVELSADDSRLYAAVRGPNTVVVLDVSGLSSQDVTGQVPVPPRFLREVPSGGNWPRHFALSTPDSGNGRIYVANQRSNNIAVFELDVSGIPGTEPVQKVKFGSPACILLSS